LITNDSAIALVIASLLMLISLIMERGRMPARLLDMLIICLSSLLLLSAAAVFYSALTAAVVVVGGVFVCLFGRLLYEYYFLRQCG